MAVVWGHVRAANGLSNSTHVMGRFQSIWTMCILRAVQVLLPYLKAKCDHLYARHAQQQGGVLGLALAHSAQQQVDVKTQCFCCSSYAGRGRLLHGRQLGESAAG
jgi:hypothetical protein